MSQAKVDKYKKEKANRKEIMKKEKMQNMIRRCIVGVAAIVLMGWIGFSAYNTYEEKLSKASVEIDFTAFDNLSQNIAGTTE